MERKYSDAIAQAIDRPASDVKQTLRALREADMVPSHGDDPKAEHIARIVLALSADLIKDVVPRVTALRGLTMRMHCDLPADAEAMIARLVEVGPNSPVLGDFDITDGFLHLGDDYVSLECLTLGGHRACARYGAPFTGIANTTTIPLATVRKLVAAIKEIE